MQERTRASLARLACVQGAACTVLVVVVLRWIAAQKPIECDATKFAPSADQEDLAAITYRRQARERQREPSRVHDAIGANWPCWWGVEVTGTVEAFRHGWKSGGNQYTDGWKFTCGLRLLADPCVIYTLGGSRNLAFEAAALETRAFCELHVFDHKDESAEAAQWFAPGQRGRVMFHRVAIAATEDLTASPPRRTLRGIMRELGHTHIDVLKANLGGGEFGVLDAEAEPLPSVGQLQLEVHLQLGANRRASLFDYRHLVERIERTGLRLFHKEVNVDHQDDTVELAFIQATWRPGRKAYTAEAVEAAADASISSHGASQKVLTY